MLPSNAFTEKLWTDGVVVVVVLIGGGVGLLAVCLAAQPDSKMAAVKYFIIG